MSVQPSSNIHLVMQKVDVQSDGCWYWTAALDKRGYGAAKYHGRSWKAHRLVYTLWVGEIPAGAVIDHLCHNQAAERGECAGGATCMHRRCCNPDHLRPESTWSNSLSSPCTEAAKNFVKTHCDHGHEFTEENTKLTRQGHRQCRKCLKDAGDRHRAKTRRFVNNADKTHCNHGHPLDSENTKVTRAGKRQCRICLKDASARFRERKRSA